MVVKSKIKRDLPFMVLDFVYKFAMICLRGTKAIEWKQNAELWDIQSVLSFLLHRCKETVSWIDS
jgi:hypothetical protein